MGSRAAVIVGGLHGGQYWGERPSGLSACASSRQVLFTFPERGVNANKGCPSHVDHLPSRPPVGGFEAGNTVGGGSG